MTISSTSRLAGPFSGNGSTVTFPFTFKVFYETDLLVETLNVAASAIAVLALTTDYSVVLNADQDVSPGGSITLTAGGLAVGLELIITTDIGELQNLDLVNGGSFYPDTMNDALDLLTVLVQQLMVQVARSIQLPLVDSGINVTLPPAAARVGMLLGFDGAGAPELVLPTLGGGGGGGGGGSVGGPVTLAFSATPAFLASAGTQIDMTLTANVASSTFNAAGGFGVFFVIKLKQDGTGGRTFVWPANMHNAGVINLAPNSTSTQLFGIDIDGSATALAPIMYS